MVFNKKERILNMEINIKEEIYDGSIKIKNKLKGSLICPTQKQGINITKIN